MLEVVVIQVVIPVQQLQLAVHLHHADAIADVLLQLVALLHQVAIADVPQLVVLLHRVATVVALQPVVHLHHADAMLLPLQLADVLLLRADALAVAAAVCLANCSPVVDA